MIERQPVRAAYRGREVLTNPPPSSGRDPDRLSRSTCSSAPRGGRRRTTPTASRSLAEVMEEANRARGGDFNAGCTRRVRRPVPLGRPLRRGEALASSGRGSAPAAATLARGTDRSARPRTSRCSTATATRPASRARTAPARACSCPGTGVHLNNMLGEEDLNPLGYHMHEPGHAGDEHDGADDRAEPTARSSSSLGSAGSNRLRSAILQVIRYVVDDGDERRRGDPSRGRLHYEAGSPARRAGIRRGGARRARAPRLPGRALEGPATSSSAAPRRRAGPGHGRAVRRRRPPPRRRRRGGH